MTDSRASIVFCCAVFVTASGATLHAACRLSPQGDGRVSGIVDARTILLSDGREVRLAGIETAGAGIAAKETSTTATATTGTATARTESVAALRALVEGRDVTLHGHDDRPDRYGRQPAFVFLTGSDVSIQSELLARGAALVSAIAADKACSAALLAAEAEARTARRGIWAGSTAIKNAERPDDILTGIGQFAVVEGKVLSARLAGATFYLNFGRRWTTDFAVTISRRMMPSFEAAGLDLKSLENKRIRVRGWVEKRGGPRIELVHAGQIELIAAADRVAKD